MRQLFYSMPDAGSAVPIGGAPIGRAIPRLFHKRSFRGRWRRDGSALLRPFRLFIAAVGFLLTVLLFLEFVGLFLDFRAFA